MGLPKHRWYQAWEHLEPSAEGTAELFREYPRIVRELWTKKEIHPSDEPEWIEVDTIRDGIDFRSLPSEAGYWWDKEVLQMLRERRS